MVENVEIEISLKDSGDFNLTAQQKISNKYQKIEEIKAVLNKELEKIEN